MKSVTSSAARNYRLQEWAAQIRECQNRLPGTSVKEWCGQQYSRRTNDTKYCSSSFKPDYQQCE
ncbi:hypothetical protein AALH30_11725 [Blautia pseudococcoides]|uniref:hypothetical protein n=1 Tax=Blautia pseudococcoides TaxID=1796616 RepID=UPI00148AF9F1|nr:hypothetical protein [Blautia pseudococcoides]QJU13525.1 hypothetical protein HL650_02985 [Blautia pseudococcoides]